MNTSTQLIQQYFQERNIDALAFFYYIKKQHSNSIIYNCTYRSAAKKLNLPLKTTTRLIKKCLLLEIAIMKNGHLHFISCQKLLIKYRYNPFYLCIFKIDKTTTLKQIKGILLSKYLQHIQNKKEYIVSLKEQCEDILLEPKLRQKYMRQLTKYCYSPEVIDKRITITYSQLSKALRIPNTTICKIIRDCVKLKLFAKEVIIEKINMSKQEYVSFREYIYAYTYYYGNSAYVKYGTHYSIPTV